MAAGAWTFVDGARQKLIDGTFDIDAAGWKCALYLSTSNISTSSTTIAGVTNEHAASFGYTAGGIAVTHSLSGTTNLLIDWATDPVWTASGGSITARYAVLHNGTNVLAFCLLDSTPADVTATDGNTLTVAANATNGVARLT